jgi:hypothetical protein
MGFFGKYALKETSSGVNLDQFELVQSNNKSTFLLLKRRGVNLNIVQAIIRALLKQSSKLLNLNFEINKAIFLERIFLK